MPETRTIALAALFAVAFAFAPEAGAANTVKAPCTTGTASGFFRPCTEVIPGFLTDLDKRVQMQADYYYGKGVDGKPMPNGLSINPSSGVSYNEMWENADATIKSDNIVSGKPVCSATANVFTNNQPELNTNHLGESCGSPIGLSVSVSRRNTSVTWNTGGSSGTKEAAFLRGLWIQAMACYVAQVKKEVDTTQSIIVSAPCDAIAHDVTERGNDSMKVFNSLTKSMGDQKGILDIKNCNNSWDTSGRQVGLDVGELRQSAQLLCAARAAQEAMFNQLMVCETFSRAGKDYRAFIGNPDSIFAQIKSGPGSTCRSRCFNQCKSCRSQGACDGCATSCANSCYESEMRNLMQDKAKRWPTDGSCSNPSAAADAATTPNLTDPSAGACTPDPAVGCMPLGNCPACQCASGKEMNRFCADPSKQAVVKDISETLSSCTQNNGNCSGVDSCGNTCKVACKADKQKAQPGNVNGGTDGLCGFSCSAIPFTGSSNPCAGSGGVLSRCVCN